MLPDYNPVSAKLAQFTQLFCLVFLLFSNTALAAKTDIIYLHNGDRITGEIKSLEQGLLVLSTDALGRVNIFWEDIASIDSQTTQRIELASGRIYIGPITRGQQDDQLEILARSGQRTVPTQEIVKITPLYEDENLSERVEGSFKVGMNYTKSSDIGSLNLGARLSLREEKFTLSTSLDSIVTYNNNDDDTSRSNLDLSYQRHLQDRWFWTTFGKLENNDELGIKLRALAGGGYGRFLNQTAHSSFSVAGGLSTSREVRNDSGDNGTHLEAVFNAQFSLFRFYPRRLQLDSALQVFPSLDDWGRLRTNLDISLTWEIVDDFVWDLTFYNTYDSGTSDSDASSSDFGVINSVGYYF